MAWNRNVCFVRNGRKVRNCCNVGNLFSLLIAYMVDFGHSRGILTLTPLDFPGGHQRSANAFCPREAPEKMNELNVSHPPGRSPVLLTTREAARHLALEPQTLEVWRGRGQGPAFVKIGALVRYEQREIEAFIERNRRRSTADPGPRKG
jgi:hypothetical protein